MQRNIAVKSASVNGQFGLLGTTARFIGSIVIGTIAGGLFSVFAFGLSSLFAEYIALTAPGESVPSLTFGTTQITFFGMVIYTVTFGILHGIFLSLLFGTVAFVRTRRWQRGIVIGLAVFVLGNGIGIPSGLLSLDNNLGLTWAGPPYFLATGIAIGCQIAAVFTLSYMLVRYFLGTYAGAIAGGMGTSMFYLVISINNQYFAPWPGGH